MSQNQGLLVPKGVKKGVKKALNGPKQAEKGLKVVPKRVKKGVLGFGRSVDWGVHYQKWVPYVWTDSVSKSTVEVPNSDFSILDSIKSLDLFWEQENMRLTPNSLYRVKFGG